jgi:hypothetical protein
VEVNQKEMIMKRFAIAAAAAALLAGCGSDLDPKNVWAVKECPHADFAELKKINGGQKQVLQAAIMARFLLKPSQALECMEQVAFSDTE